MQFECIQCQKGLKLPDSKLPVGKPFSFTCPYCKAKNTAMIPADQETPPLAPPAEETAAFWPPSPPPPLATNEVNGEGCAAPAPPLPRPGGAAEVYSPYPEAGAAEEQMDLSGAADDRPKALVVYDDPETAELLVKKLDEINYRAVAALNLRDAAKQIKFTKFGIILLQEDYFGSSLSGNHLLRSIQVMDNHSRRGMLVALISPTMVTLDDLAAFSLSVDAVINVADVGRIGQMLQSSIAQAKKFYAIYEEALTEHGLD
jgi:CheY-like chemotaxis protein